MSEEEISSSLYSGLKSFPADDVEPLDAEEKEIKKEEIEDDPTAYLRLMIKQFPYLIPCGKGEQGDILANGTIKILRQENINPRETLLMTSICPDEGNRNTLLPFTTQWELEYFPIGGLAGYPFGGVTAMDIALNHVDTSNLLIIFGPHIGINKKGEFNTADRYKHSSCSTSCCESLNSSLKQITNGEIEKHPPKNDYQQWMITKNMSAFKAQLLQEPKESLPKKLMEVAYSFILEEILSIVNITIKKNPRAKIAILGGIVINTPGHNHDHFQIGDFKLFTKDKETDLWPRLAGYIRRKMGV